MELSDLILYVMHYYEKRLGYCPQRSEWADTLRSVWYMKINGLDDPAVFRELERHSSTSIPVGDLSDSLWEGSLAVRNHFYFHKELQLVSPAPRFSLAKGVSAKEFWCVPRIRYTAEDLIRYFYSRFPKEEAELYLGHDDTKTIRYLLDRFQHQFTDLEPLDVILCLIDEMTRDENRQNKKGLISVTDYFGNTIETLRKTYREAAARGLNKPRWPQCF